MIVSRATTFHDVLELEDYDPGLSQVSSSSDLDGKKKTTHN
jgi:hypothetical protein